MTPGRRWCRPTSDWSPTVAPQGWAAAAKSVAGAGPLGTRRRWRWLSRPRNGAAQDNGSGRGGGPRAEAAGDGRAKPLIGNSFSEGSDPPGCRTNPRPRVRGDEPGGPGSRGGPVARSAHRRSDQHGGNRPLVGRGHVRRRRGHDGPEGQSAITESAAFWDLRVSKTSKGRPRRDRRAFGKRMIGRLAMQGIHPFGRRARCRGA